MNEEKHLVSEGSEQSLMEEVDVMDETDTELTSKR